MTEFKFFTNREERWSDSMRALWGSLSICPLLDHVDLPYHMAGDLKVWGDTQKPQDSMVYLLVRVEDASEVEGYGIAVVWISPHQAQASTMEEALGIVSTCVSSGSDWPYILTQLYEGTNHVPLSQGQALQHPAPGKGGEPMWVDQPTQSLPALICQTMSHLSIGFEWGQPVSHH